MFIYVKMCYMFIYVTMSEIVIYVKMKNKLAESIEHEVYRESKRLTGYVYRRRVRKLVFSLRGDESLREDVLKQTITIPQLVARL